MTQDEVTHSNDLPRTLGPWAALSVIVGSVIGSGIFIVPAGVAKSVPTIAGIALIWIVGGIFSLCGALTLAELAAMLPRAGGPYVYLREAYGRLPAFLFGWTEFLIMRAGSVATLASAFAIYAAQPQLFPAPKAMNPLIWQMILAVSAMVSVAIINVLGTRASGSVQIVGTMLKVGALVAMIVLPFVLGKVNTAYLHPFWPHESDRNLIHGFLAALIGVLWTYDGWVNTSSMAEEIRDPGKNIPRALIQGMALLIAIYLGVTLVYHLVLPMGEIASGTREKGSGHEVAALFCNRLFGQYGALGISAIVVCSTLISLNGNALSGPRAYFAMARDGLFPAAIAQIHPRFKTPANAIIAQATWSVILTVSATLFLVATPPESGLPAPILNTWKTFHERPLYDVLFTYVIFGGTVFYTFAIGSVFVLRRTRPDLHRPYRTTGYPITPTIYVIASLILIADMLRQTPVESLVGLGIIAAGLPGYLVFARRKP